jgi:hypothetical protein
VIQRLGDHDDTLTGSERSSTELAGDSSGPAGTIQALDGTVIDEEALIDEADPDAAGA